MKCPSCGAQYDKKLLNCPFCKGENTLEAERRYQAELKAIDTATLNLKYLPQKIAQFVSKYMTRILLAGLVIFTFGFIAMQVFGILVEKKQLHDIDKNKQVLETYLIEGKYEKMADYLLERTSYDAAYLKYREVADAFSNLLEIRRSKAALNGENEDYLYGVKSALYYGNELLQEAGEAIGDQTVRGNEAVLKSFIDETYAYFYEDLKLEDEKLEELSQYDFVDPFFDKEVRVLIAQLGLEQNDEME